MVAVLLTSVMRSQPRRAASARQGSESREQREQSRAEQSRGDSHRPSSARFPITRLQNEVERFSSFSVREQIALFTVPSLIEPNSGPAKLFFGPGRVPRLFMDAALSLHGLSAL